jgi:FkbM family methyltransferase
LRKHYSLSRLLRAAISIKYKGHFSQFGEDAIICRQFPDDFVGTYLDIGAFHPFKWSNTARLWLTGWNGVNVDANRNSIRRFTRHRPLDRNIWGAVVPQSQYQKGGTVAFTGTSAAIDPIGRVVLPNEAEQPGGITQVPTLSLAEIASYFDHPVDFMNVDIEGLDETIIADNAFEKLAPHVLAIEQHGQDLAEILRRESTQRLLDGGYIMIGRCIATSVFRRRQENDTR